MKKGHERLMLAMWRNVGHCAKCISTSFQFSIVFWSLAILATLLGSSTATWISVLIAIAATSLWITHIVVFALKDVLLVKRERHKLGAEGLSSSGFTRRSALPIFARSLALVAATTMLLPGQAKAVNCTSLCTSNSDCPNGCYCTSRSTCSKSN